MRHYRTRLVLELLESRLTAGSSMGIAGGGTALATSLSAFRGGDSQELTLVKPSQPVRRSATILGGADGGETLSGPTFAALQSPQDALLNRVSGSDSIQISSTAGSDSVRPHSQDRGSALEDSLRPFSDNVPSLTSRSAGFTGSGQSSVPIANTASQGGAGAFSGGAIIPLTQPPDPISPPQGGGDRFGQNLAVANGLSSIKKGGGGDVQIADTRGLTIPQNHARIWWTPDRLAQAQDWYKQNPFNPPSDNPFQNAFKYVLTGDSTSARIAITSLLNFTISDAELQGVASDTYRWSDWVPVVYDWTYDAMTPVQRTTFMARYNIYATIMMAKTWGGPGMEYNNYYWGYFRNEFNWAVATWYENPLAQTFLDDALVTRWQNGFLPYTLGDGRGGVTPEGSDYGRTMLAYPVVPATTAAILGRDLYSETNFYKEAIFNLIYSTTPAPTGKPRVPDRYYQTFPFGDSNRGGGYPAVVENTYNGNFMYTVAAEYGDLPVGQYAYNWINTIDPPTDPWVTSTYQDGKALDFGSLPVDYYAPGYSFFYTRNQWGEQATSLFYQLGQANLNADHSLDAGSFQIWRNGEFVSKASNGEGTQFNGGTSNDTSSRNSILFGGRGMARANQLQPAQTLRLQSSDDFSYAAVDLSGTYRSTSGDLDNRTESRTTREFIYIKPLETMVVLDRLEASGEAGPPQNVQKTFLLHFPQQPYTDGANSIVGTNNGQTLRMTTLLPASPQYNIVDEGDFSGHHEPDPAWYQYRAELNTRGSAQSYFLNVLQARDANGANVSSQMTENANSWTITLDHPTLGHAKIVLNKGMDSVGGQVGYSATGTPSLVPLLDHVQSQQITNDGPQWGK